MDKRAGLLPDKSMLIDIRVLVDKYYSIKPDPENKYQLVSFGTSGHRGCSLNGSFNEDHILAVCQAVAEYRKSIGTTGPLFLGKDTHALSGPAWQSAVEVLTANDVMVMVDRDNGYTPTPAISHAILNFNKGKPSGLADGIVITPSHNPPEDGGIKYNPTNGGPADIEVTKWIEERANSLLMNGNKGVKRQSNPKTFVTSHDYINEYVSDLINIIDLEAISQAGIRIGADPMGGSGLAYWEPIAKEYGLKLEIVNKTIDPTFRFIPLDHDGKIRMDCSSPYVMAGLLGQKDKYDIAFGNDPDFDRHGIVTRSTGLMNPNHYLAVAINYLFQNRPGWKNSSAVGKTMVSSSMIDKVAQKTGRRLVEVPVGFKWFVAGLLNGDLGFGGEESAGASFLRKDGTAWTTDKDGIIMDLLAAEILAKTQKDPGEHYLETTKMFGPTFYQRVDIDSSPGKAAAIKKLKPDDLSLTEIAGERIISIFNRAPGNNAEIGGLKIVTANGWSAVRPSGTEPKYKIYAESFISPEHLDIIVKETSTIVGQVTR